MVPTLVAIFPFAVILAGGAFAFWKYWVDDKHRRWLDAKALYASVLDDQLNNPDLRGNNWKEISSDPEKLHRYSVLMNKLLWALEGMLRVDSKEQEWRRSAIVIANIHQEYLQSADFKREEDLFSNELREALAKGMQLPVDKSGHLEQEVNQLAEPTRPVSAD